jgi:hypothetical protein
MHLSAEKGAHAALSGASWQEIRVRSRRSKNEVNMIGHETVRPHLDPGPAGLLSQQISINLLVAVLKKGLYIKGSPNSHTLCITDGFENPTQRNGFLNKCLKVMTTTSLRYGLGEEDPNLNTCFAPTCTGCAARIDSLAEEKRQRVPKCGSPSGVQSGYGGAA